MILSEAYGHPGYNDAVRYAAEQASKTGSDCWSVWYDGDRVFVRPSSMDKPPNALHVCIAQRWDNNTIQLRFAGARSEWVKVP